jgi:hypothetical protein
MKEKLTVWHILGMCLPLLLAFWIGINAALSWLE